MLGNRNESPRTANGASTTSITPNPTRRVGRHGSIVDRSLGGGPARHVKYIIKRVKENPLIFVQEAVINNRRRGESLGGGGGTGEGDRR
ncbi:hypothetical protein J6590_080326 [Homalodisca vitripennis]|nr:hypothetical protein J6590_080326 [Homalodisca vitripennis]